MKKKLTTLLFGLLLAVGWTSTAQAQLLPSNAVSNSSKYTSQAVQGAAVEQDVEMASADYQPGGLRHAPRRAASDYTTPIIHTKDWYSNFTYTWMDGTSQKRANLTDVVTNPDQMWYFLKYIYTTPEIPGPLYNKAYETANTYPTFSYGWNITADYYNNIVLTFNNSYAYFRQIIIADFTSGTTLASWSSTGSSVTALPSGWSSSKTIQNTNLGSWYSTDYACYMNGGGTITIPGSVAAGHDGLKITVAARTTTNGGGTVNINGALATLGTSWGNWANTSAMQLPSFVNSPVEDGYTICLVKVTNKTERAPSTTSSYSDLVNIFTDYIESIELLTDGLRVGEDGTTSAGTVFCYTGTLNRFFFIGKGKLAKFGYVAPFYGMFEEFSPTTTAEGAEISDFYAEMTAGNAYGIVHDCQGVLQQQHAFSMSGNASDDEKSMSSLVFYIPDDRGRSPYDSIPEGATTPSTYNSRNYEHKPQVGLYTIRLAAETEPSSTYAQDSTYTVYLDWTSSLNTMVQNEVPQTYVIYKVTFDEQGNRAYTYLTTVNNDTHYEYNEQQLQNSQTFTYVILGYPTNATNKPVISSTGEVQTGGGNFFTYSNIDDVQIPGWFDFMVLYRERYESDFVISEEKNYYRNYLYPTNLTPGTGMTMGQLKQEWPNQTASYTLWRDNTGVAVLEIRGIGNKVYYRIRYYDDTQVKTGPNNITVPNYQTMDNN